MVTHRSKNYLRPCTLKDTLLCVTWLLRICLCRILLWNNENVTTVYKPWKKLLLKNKKFDGFIWSVSWTQKRDVSDWIDDSWWASETYADMGKKKCGIVIAKVAFCINASSYDINVGNYSISKYTIYLKKVNR